MEKLNWGFLPYWIRKNTSALSLWCTFFSASPACLSSVTSSLSCVGVDNSGHLSLSWEPLHCPDVALLQVHKWGNVSKGSSFSQLPSFVFRTTFPISSFLAFSSPFSCHPFTFSSVSLTFPTIISGYFPSLLDAMPPVGPSQTDSPTSPATITMASWLLMSIQKCGDQRHSDYHFRGYLELTSKQKTCCGRASSAAAKTCRSSCPKQGMASRCRRLVSLRWATQWEPKCN